MSSIETLGEAHNAGWRFSASCRHGVMDTGSLSRRCDWKFDLCTTTLLATRGRDFPIQLLSDRLRCPRCGSRRISVMFIVPGTPTRKAATG